MYKSVSPDVKGLFSALCKLNILHFEKENLADFWWKKTPVTYLYMKYAMTDLALSSSLNVNYKSNYGKATKLELL